MTKEGSLFWNSSSGERIKDKSIEGLKSVGKIIIIGVTLGLASKAFNSVRN
ncbi:MAG: hypothetical protein WC346_17265 [Methanogenium sp.]|jgi:hypothetical protein